MGAVAWVVFAYVVTYGFVIVYAGWMLLRRKKLETSSTRDQS